MRKYAILFLLCMHGAAYADPAPINNAVPPCDNLHRGDKPSCDADAGGVKTPPITADDHKAIIVPPEIPAEGLPNQTQKPGADTMDNPSTNKR